MLHEEIKVKALGWFIGGVGVLEAYAAFGKKNDVWLKRIVAGMVLFGDVAHLILPRLLSGKELKNDDIVGVSLASLEVAALSYLIWKSKPEKKSDWFH